MVMLFSRSARQTPYGEFVNRVPRQSSRLQRLRRCAASALPGLIALVPITFIAYEFNFSVASTSALYLLVVVMQSISGDFAAAAIVSFCGFGSLDYFFTVPKFSFAVADPLELLDLVAFLVVALVITRLMSQLRVEVRAAKTERGRTERLFRLAQDLLTLEPRAVVDVAFLESFRRVFDMRAICVFDKETGELHSAGETRASLVDQTRATYFANKD